MRPVFWAKWRYQNAIEQFVLLSSDFPLYIKHTWEAILWLFSIMLKNSTDLSPP